MSEETRQLILAIVPLATAAVTLAAAFLNFRAQARKAQQEQVRQSAPPGPRKKDQWTKFFVFILVAIALYSAYQLRLILVDETPIDKMVVVRIILHLGAIAVNTGTAIASMLLGRIINLMNDHISITASECARVDRLEAALKRLTSEPEKRGG
jgi:hypothetical protein